MQSQHQPTGHSWYVLILTHVLSRHTIQLSLHENQQMALLCQVVSRFSPAPFDYLEILRLFDEALSKREQLKIAERRLSTLEIFYASVIVGLKIYNETHKYTISLREILRYLPRESDYYQKSKESRAIQDAFLVGMNWELQPVNHDTLKAYDRLFDGLWVEPHTQLAASILVTIGVGAGDYHSLLEVLSRRFDNQFVEKSLKVISVINHLPLMNLFINNSFAMHSLFNDVHLFMTHNEELFSISQETKESIGYAIIHYYQVNAIPINQWKMDFLSHYFDETSIKNIIGATCITTLTNLSHEESWGLSWQYQGLVKAINLKYIDSMWLLPILNELELLSKQGALNANMLLSIFNNINHSEAILRHYLDLHREGWLKVILTSDELFEQVSNVIHRAHPIDCLTPRIADLMKIYFTNNLPTIRVLKKLCKRVQSKLGAEVIDQLAYMRYSDHMNRIVTKLGAHPYHCDILSRMDAYYHDHYEDQIQLLLQLEVIENELCEENVSLAIMLLSEPNLVIYRTELIINLKETFDSLNLNAITDQLPFLYNEILSNIVIDERLNEVIANLCLGRHLMSPESIAVFETIDSVKETIRAILEAHIENGSLKLPKDALDRLNQFYKAYEMEISVALKTNSLRLGFFSHETSESVFEQNGLINGSQVSLTSITLGSGAKKRKI